MKKIILILAFTLLYYSSIFGQAQVDIPISATDGIFTYQLAVGLDLTATNCIDSHLGEYDFNPPPLDFLIVFDLAPYGCPFLITFKDYRPPGNPPIFPFTGMIEHTLWWNTSSANTPINISYNLPAGTSMMITDQIGGSFLNIGPFTGQGTATIPGTYTNIFHKALLKMEYTSIVPVEFTSYTASVMQNEKAVQLNWSTATETNNSGFEIYKKKIGNRNQEYEWEKIGYVPGFGTTTEPKSYSFIDENVTTGTYKYRLKQIDFDGSFEYSNEIELEIDFTPKQFVLYQNYPNPFNPTTKIKYSIPVGTQRAVSLRIYDVLGNEVATIVNEEKPAGNFELEFNAADLPSGIYFYQLKAGSFVESKKMILLK